MKKKVKKDKREIKKKQDSMIEKEYWEEYEVVDPKTGDIIKKRVKVTKYKSTYKPLDSNEVASDNILDIVLPEGEEDVLDN